MERRAARHGREGRGLSADDRARLIAVARGDAEPDLVITGARVFSAFTREWLSGDVAIADGRIAGVGGPYAGARETIDAGGRWLAPGFIDAHVHIESSKLVPAEFARAVVPLGTTCVVTDPHELANVLGVDGVHWLLDATADLPLRVYVMAPSCVPASPLETAKTELTAADMAAVLERDRALGVAEMMNFPGVIAGEPDVLERVALPGATHVDGHAPAVVGASLDAYAAAGIRSDHEAITPAEMLEKRRRGMWVLMREASNARNLDAGIALVREHGPDYTAFCTDDREPTTLVDEGHIGGMAARAVAAGVRPEDALVMATLHAARAHRIEDLGAIAPGYHADLLLLDDLTSFAPSLVLRAGAVVARDGVAEPFRHAPAPAWTTGTVKPAPVTSEDLTLGAAPASGARVRVMDIVLGQLITGAAEEDARVVDGAIVADPARDLAKIAVVERHHASGNVGVGLVRGFQLREGAFASTVAHDAHNVVVCGVDDSSMLACVERLTELGGGVVVARDGSVIGEQALPVAGLLADEPLERVAAKLVELEGLLAEQGVTSATPFMTLSFLALSVIPDLKVTDQGLVDVLAAKIVPLTV